MSKAFHNGIADGEAGKQPAPNRKGAYRAGWIIGESKRQERQFVADVDQNSADRQTRPQDLLNRRIGRVD